MKHTNLAVLLLSVILASCAPVDLNDPVPFYDTGVDPDAWADIPAGSFLQGQFNEAITIAYDYQMMITDVTVAQYIDFLNMALGNKVVKIAGNKLVGYYPGDIFHGVKHEIRIDPGDYIFVPLNDPASPYTFDGKAFSAKAGRENHPMSNVAWFGAWAYCDYLGWRLPSEMEWEKSARGSMDDRPFPWGDTIARNNANYYKSGDPFENMTTFGSRTSPVGFFNGNNYGGYVTLASVSPYGLYDMAGNVWQWLGDVIQGFSDRLMHGGSKDTYDMDLRIWVCNSAPPMYFAPDIGFRCARTP